MAQVLVVDDSVHVRNEVCSFLEANDIEVATAGDGLQGLKAVQSDSNIRLLIVDVQMPYMDGLTMVEKMRESGIATPVIMLTTENSPSTKKRGKDAGVKGWIIKPFNGEAALAGIKKFIAD